MGEDPGGTPVPPRGEGDRVIGVVFVDLGGG